MSSKPFLVDSQVDCPQAMGEVACRPRFRLVVWSKYGDVLE